LALLRALPAARRFYWEQPDAGIAIAGVGEAIALRAAGHDRLGRAAAARLALPAGGVLVGGFAFDPAAVPSGAWSGFGAATWHVPRVALVRRDGETRLIAAGPATAPLAAELARARAALARPPDGAAGPRRYVIHAPRATSAWRRAVADTLADIAAGRLVKLVLARAVRLQADAPLDALRVAARLRQAYPGCTVFAVGAGPATFVGATPERLVRVEGSRVLTAAVAGTAARGATAGADAHLAAGLLASAKERAEHACVVDDLRARLASVCRDIEGPPAPSVITTESVQHLHTPIVARLRPGRGLLEVADVLHPTPAICGAPRADALAVLAGRERLARGWYGGGVGWLDADGGEVAVAIRAALVRGAHATLFAGAGIVAGSDPEAELEETRLKLRPLLGALLEL
jgi:isochorismate synthase